MRKPNIERKSQSIQKTIERYVTESVRPYALELLNTAQAKLSVPISFCQGMGVWHYDLDGDTDSVLQRMVDRPQQYYRIAARFPELLEFEQLVLDLGEHFNTELGDIEPTVNPRAKGRLRIQFEGRQ